MKKITIDFKKISTVLVLALTLFILFAAPSTVSAQTDDTGDKYVLGGRYRLKSGETINGSMFIFGGTGILEPDSVINGDVVLVGGTLEVSGTINGSINAVGGTITLLDQAIVNGDVNITSVSLTTSPNATVSGNINENVFDIEDVQIGQLPDGVTVPQITTSPVKTGVDFIVSFLWACLRILAVSAFAALIVLLAEKPTDRVKQSIMAQPLIASAFGLLTIIVAPALLVILCITIILIPVALIGLLILGLAGLLGWVAIGYEVGQRIEKGLKQNWAPAITAGIGTLLLTMGSSLFGIIPCIGWIIPTIISMVGLGGVLISRFGTNIYSSSNGGGSHPTNVNTSDLPEINVKDVTNQESGSQPMDNNKVS